MLALILLSVGILARFVFHIPNFTPVIAIALFGGFYLDKKYAILLPLALMMITDVFLGLHNVIPFTWGSLALIAFVGLKARRQKSVTTVAATSLASAVGFFVITNFGVWLATDLYAKNMAGLITCYQMALPFFRALLAGTALYALALFGGYELIAAQVKKTKLAKTVL
jgi:hypothetical protein